MLFNTLRCWQLSGDGLDPLLSGVVNYGLIYAEADVTNREEITIGEFYDDPEQQINVVRVFIAAMLVFQILFFVVLLPQGFLFCCRCLEKIAEAMAVIFGILASACGAVGILIWYFMVRNDREDLLASALFDGLIMPEDVNIDDFSFGWSFWTVVGAVVLEILATIFVLATCCLCCAEPKEAVEDEKPDEEAPAQAEEEDDVEAEAEYEEEDLVEEEVEEEVEMEEEEEEVAAEEEMVEEEVEVEVEPEDGYVEVEAADVEEAAEEATAAAEEAAAEATEAAAEATEAAAEATEAATEATEAAAEAATDAAAEGEAVLEKTASQSASLMSKV